MTSSELRQSAITLLDAADVLHVVSEAVGPEALGPMHRAAALRESGVRSVAALLLDESRKAERMERP